MLASTVAGALPMLKADNCQRLLMAHLRREVHGVADKALHRDLAEVRFGTDDRVRHLVAGKKFARDEAELLGQFKRRLPRKVANDVRARVAQHATKIQAEVVAVFTCPKKKCV